MAEFKRTPRINLLTAIFRKYEFNNVFAKVADTSSVRVSWIIRGRADPTEKERIEWSELLGESAEHLFDEV